jgi:hypothetical protein
MNQRKLAELRSLFGRSAVEDAIARKFELNQWRIEHARAVANATSELMAVIQHPPDAVAYAASLEPQLRAALIIAIVKA